MNALVREVRCEIAAVHRWECQLVNGRPRSILHMVTSLEPNAAEALGIWPLVYTVDNIAKGGFTELRLQLVIEEPYQIMLTVPGLEQFALDMQGDAATHFRVVYANQQLGLRFRLITLGNPHEIIDWLIRHAGATAVLDLRILQLSLTLEGEPAAEAPAPPPDAPPTRDNIDQALRGIAADLEANPPLDEEDD